MINLRENKKINAATGTNYNRYLVDIQFKSIKYLSKQDEIRLFKQLNTKNDKDARTTIVKATQPLVIAIANKLHSRKHPIEELICIGNEALCKYMDKFDVTRGYRFTSFIVKYISGSMMMEIRKAKDDVSLDVETADATTLHDLIPSTDISLVPNAEYINQQVNKALESLTPLEADIISMLFGLNYYEQTDGTEIASLLDIKYYHYQQYKKAALKKLKRSVLLKELFELF